MECAEGKLNLDGISNPNPILELPETSPAGTDQVVWRDNEEIGEGRENLQVKLPKVIIHADLEIPTWLQENTVREHQSKVEISHNDQWSCASSDAEDEEQFEWDEQDIENETIKNDLENASETEPELDTYDLKRDLEEACGLSMALEMRYVPDGTHCIATWNANYGFDTKAIATIMLRCNISILFVQEPKAKVTDVDIGFISKGLMQYGLRGYCTRHQFMVYNEATLGALR